MFCFVTLKCILKCQDKHAKPKLNLLIIILRSDDSILIKSLKNV